MKLMYKNFFLSRKIILCWMINIFMLNFKLNFCMLNFREGFDAVFELIYIAIFEEKFRKNLQLIFIFILLLCMYKYELKLIIMMRIILVGLLHFFIKIHFFFGFAILFFTFCVQKYIERYLQLWKSLCNIFFLNYFFIFYSGREKFFIQVIKIFILIIKILFIYLI